MPHPQRQLAFENAGWWIAALVFVVIAWPGFVFDDAPLLSCFTDDTYYYLGVARQVANGNGFTFDGVHPTNGFQPLWLFLLVPLFLVIRGEFVPLRALIVGQAILLAFSAMLLWRILKPRVPPGVAAAVPLLLIGLPGARLLWLGMESSLFLSLILLTWVAWIRVAENESAPLRDWVWLGIACGVVWLGRLEGAIALPVALVFLAPRLRRMKRPIPRLAAICGPAAGVASIYLAWNVVSFGIWLPISGKVKMHWVAHHTMQQRLLALVDIPWIGRHLLVRAAGDSRPPTWALIACGAVLIAAVPALIVFRHHVRRWIRDTGTGYIITICALMFVADHLLIGPVLGEWALVPLHLLTVLAIAGLLSRWRRAASVALAAALLLCVVRLPAQQIEASSWENSFSGRSYHLAQWLRAETAPDARVGVSYAGILGYFSHRTVINLDGLVNSNEFFEQVLAGDAWESYLRAERITWLADVGCSHHGPVPGILRDLGKVPGKGDCYRLAHVIRDPVQPSGCGLVLWQVFPERCEGP